MKNHVWRPLFVVLAVVATLLLIRSFVVPKDFGVYPPGYMYGWHRRGNEAEWRSFGIKYRTSRFCRDCHPRNFAELTSSPHAGIACENCHGPAAGHPQDPRFLPKDRSRQLCLRCHALLPMPGSGRAKIRGVDGVRHNPDAECVLCHYPHDPRREVRQ